MERPTILRHRGKLEAWCEHIGGEFIDREDSIECHLPENLGILHANEEVAFLHNAAENDTQSGDHKLRFSGVENGTPTQHAPRVEEPLGAIVTLEDEFGTIEITNEPGLMTTERELLRIEVHYNPDREEDQLHGNWASMTPEQRGRLLDSIGDSHHKEILKNELDAAGYDYKTG